MTTSTPHTEPEPYDYVVWLDAETTGLNYRDDLILEVACQVTTEADPLTVVDGYQSLVASWLQPWPTEIHPAVREMHTANGLFHEITIAQNNRLPGLHEVDVGNALEGFMRRWAGARLGGDGQHFDWRWICDQWGDRIFEPLHYRQIDVSQLHQNFKANAPSHVYEEDPGTKDLHRAVADVMASRHMYAHYRSKIRRLEAAS